MNNHSPGIRNSARYNGLLEQVLETQLDPQDSYQIAALLESMGWNDLRVAREFDVSDIFELADLMWGDIQSKVGVHTFSAVEKHNGFA
ncbi:hypothetical protein JQK62_19365, partial [Leptospira santarosai]|nr:hypothetical protein [Leptospira santarosai]